MEKKNLTNGTLFILEKPFDPRSKWLFVFYCIAFFALVSWYFSSIGTAIDLTSLLLFAAIVAGYIIAGYRVASNASRTETILVTSTTLEITQRSWFFRKTRKYNIDDIEEFRFIERPSLTAHPLGGVTFDYLGFQTAQQVINEMYGENRIAFYYNGDTISFGKNLYSWDYEELLLSISPTNHNN